jgi:citrate synthase
MDLTKITFEDAVQKNLAYSARQLDACQELFEIEPDLYFQNNVQRGLRDVNGNGVLVGLTNISTVTSKRIIDGRTVHIDGELSYRGYRINDLMAGLANRSQFGFEEIAYLLLFAELPDESQLQEFKDIIAVNRTLPTNFVRDIILKAPNRDIMNSMTRSVLTLASYDPKMSDTSLENVLIQSIKMIAQFPMLAVYAYHAYNHYEQNDSLYIHRPDPSLSMAENILRMLRPDSSYTELEARALDAALILHMEHGGGNNSTFTTRVVTSSGADTYSVLASALSSLKGPKHGGANIKVMEMMADIRAHVSDPENLDELDAYLSRILHKEAFDRTGLIYGCGHAIYSLSDPRAVILEQFAGKLAQEKGLEKEYELYQNVAARGLDLIRKQRRIYKGVCVNVDFYSGFVYSMLNIPVELYTPIFAMARVVGWCAHRMEQLINEDKIMRPAYRSVSGERPYIPIEKR